MRPQKEAHRGAKLPYLRAKRLHFLRFNTRANRYCLNQLETSLKKAYTEKVVAAVYLCV